MILQLLIPGNNVWILGGVVLLVPTVDVYLSILQQVNLGPLTVILPLTGELASLEPASNIYNTGWSPKRAPADAGKF